MKGRVLIIAGSDSGGGAGIQGDIKTVTALNGYAMTAVTAITVQNSKGVLDVHAVPPSIIAAQMRAVLEDFGADSLKTGMLHDAATIRAVTHVLDGQARGVPLVVDPVMAAKSGAALLEESAIEALMREMIPRAAVFTPNLPEAEALLGRRIALLEDMRAAAKDLHALGAAAVLLKGGHLAGDAVTDVLWDGHELSEWQSPRIATRHTHGTGCALASAIATFLAQGESLKMAVARARAYVQGAIKAAPGFGHGAGPLNHGWMVEGDAG